MAHREMHVPEELIEGAETKQRLHVVEGGEPPGRRGERLLELGSVIVLSLAVLATAWSGYHAARWSGEESRKYAEASVLRVAAAEDATRVGDERIDDLLYFDGWLDAYTSGNRRLAAVYERRFRPEFQPVFRAWLAQRPFTNPDAVPGPLYMPQYRLATRSQATHLEAQADRLYREGVEAKHHDDSYILSTVFFAAVLFFASVSMRLEWWRLRLVVFGLGSAMLLAGLTWVASQPIA